MENDSKKNDTRRCRRKQSTDTVDIETKHDEDDEIEEPGTPLISVVDGTRYFKCRWNLCASPCPNRYIQPYIGMCDRCLEELRNISNGKPNKNRPDITRSKAHSILNMTFIC